LPVKEPLNQLTVAQLVIMKKWNRKFEFLSFRAHQTFIEQLKN